jgi:hypothetical protein
MKESLLVGGYLCDYRKRMGLFAKESTLTVMWSVDQQLD